MQLFYILAFFNIVKAAVNPESYPLDINSLNSFQRENKNVDTYLHTEKLFNTINSGLKKFEHIETKKSVKKEINNYEGLSSQVLHKTTTTIELFHDKQYFSLDDVIVSQNIHKISKNYIIDCSPKNINIHDYYVGTSNSNHKDILSQSNHGTQVGFIFSRQVVSLEKYMVEKKTCKKIGTETVHPLQIMNTKIVSEINFPYSRIVIPTSRHLSESDKFLQPDPPLLLCDDNKVLSKLGNINRDGGDSIDFQGIPVDYNYALDLNGNECIDISTTVPGSINFNHASGTRAINQAISLGNGITCTNCYSFLGAGILAVFNIFGGKSSTFAFEAKDAGGAGFNIAISINNPTITLSKIINLAKEGPVTSIPIITGLSLKVNFGGAWATVKGSGSAKGQASFSSGYTLIEEDHIMYANSRWSAQHSLINSNQLKPTYRNDGIKLSTSSLSVIVSVSARVKFSFGGMIPLVKVGATIDFSSVLTATAQYIKGGNFQSLALTMMDQNDRYLRDNHKIYYPGDTLHFNIKYIGLNPNKEHHLFLNLHKQGDDSNGRPIFMHKFKSSSTGNGETKIDWKIPHDTKLSQRNCKKQGPMVDFSVHSSSRLNRYFSNKKICLMQRRNNDKDNIFTYPKDGLTLSTSKNIHIQWKKDGLKHFKNKQGTDGIGVSQIPKKINLAIVSSDNGKAYQLANNINNTGTYYTKFPDDLLKNGHRYFMVIHDSDEYSHIAWQNKGFSLIKPVDNHIDKHIPNRNNDSIHLNPIDIFSPVFEDGTRLWNVVEHRNITTGKIIGKQQRILAGPYKCPRDSLSIMLQIEFGFDGFTVLGRKMPLGSTASNPFVIIPQTNFCI